VRGGQTIVRERDERDDRPFEGVVRRIEDRDPELLAVDRVGEESVERREVRIGLGGGDLLECRPIDAEVQAKDSRTIEF